MVAPSVKRFGRLGLPPSRSCLTSPFLRTYAVATGRRTAAETWPFLASRHIEPSAILMSSPRAGCGALPPARGAAGRRIAACRRNRRLASAAQQRSRTHRMHVHQRACSSETRPRLPAACTNAPGSRLATCGMNPFKFTGTSCQLVTGCCRLSNRGLIGIQSLYLQPMQDLPCQATASFFLALAECAGA